jgi:serine/threonine protein phosphatase PrpC
LASDGLWDVMSSCGAVEYVLELQQDGHTRDEVATLLVEEALRRGTYDNITVVIIWLDQNHRSSSIRHEHQESSSI